MLGLRIQSWGRHGHWPQEPSDWGYSQDASQVQSLPWQMGRAGSGKVGERPVYFLYEWRGLWQTKEWTPCLQGAVENQLQSLLCKNARQSHQISCGYRKLAYFIKNCKVISSVPFFKTFSQNMVCALCYKGCPSIQFNLIMLLLTIIGILLTSM